LEQALFAFYGVAYPDRPRRQQISQFHAVLLLSSFFGWPLA